MYYAACKTIPMCFSFSGKKLRDEWIERQETHRRERYENDKQEFFAECPTSADYSSLYPEYTPDFYSLTAKEAMKLFGRKNCWGERKICVHKHIRCVTDNF